MKRARFSRKAGVSRGAGVMAVAALGLALLGCAADQDAHPYDGPWMGVTGQAHALTFQIQNDRLVELSVQMIPQGPNACAPFVLGITDSTALAVIGSTIDINAALFRFTGRFADEASASGVVEYKEAPFGAEACDPRTQTTWTATRGMRADAGADGASDR